MSILAERRPYRECRKAVANYKEESSESDEDNFQDVDSSFNQSLEDNSIEAQIKALKNRNLVKKLEGVTEELEGCKLDGSAIVFDDSGEEVVEGHVFGQADCNKVADPNMPDIVNFEDEKFGHTMAFHVRDEDRTKTVTLTKN